MWNTPSQERLNQILRLYETENTPLADKLIHLHFFVGGCDWYVAEYDGKDRFWGYAILNGDHVNAEWGYFLFSELKKIKIDGWCEIDCETEAAWTVRTAGEIEKSMIM